MSRHTLVDDTIAVVVRTITGLRCAWIHIGVGVVAIISAVGQPRNTVAVFVRNDADTVHACLGCGDAIDLAQCADVQVSQHIGSTGFCGIAFTP